MCKHNYVGVALMITCERSLVYSKSMAEDVLGLVRLLMCDGIWENPPYGICVRFEPCVFLKSRFCYIHVKQTSNCSRHLRRLILGYKSEISLHFNSSSLYSCCTWSLLLRVLIRILTSGLSRYH